MARLAQDRAADFDEHDVHAEIERRLREDGAKRGAFARVHVAPSSTSEVADEKEARLVVLGPAHPHQGRRADSEARRAAEAMLEWRGANPRLYKNTLVFLAPDVHRLRDLEGRVRQFLAWSSIERDAEALNLTPVAARQAATKRREAETAVSAQIGEAWSWCLIPEQSKPLGDVDWIELRAAGQDALAERATRKLVPEELLMPVMGAGRLRMELERALWGDRDHVGVGELYDWFCRFLYLPRLRDAEVLLGAVQEGVGGVVAFPDFAYAEAYDEEREVRGTARRQRGLRSDGRQQRAGQALSGSRAAR